MAEKCDGVRLYGHADFLLPLDFHTTAETQSMRLFRSNRRASNHVPGKLPVRLWAAAYLQAF